MTARVYRDPAPEVPATARPGAPSPSTRDELAELVAVRGLLCELRPGDTRDPRGPLEWSPLEHAPTHTEPGQGALARRIRVQTSVGPSEGPRDAFASAASVTRGVEADREIRRIEAEGGADAARTLTWMQRCGTLADGLGALYVAAGQALSTEAQRERWARRAVALADESRRQRGRDAVLYALRWWRGERPVCSARPLECGGSWGGIWGGAGCREVAARCHRPETMRARGPRCRRM